MWIVWAAPAATTTVEWTGCSPRCPTTGPVCSQECFWFLKMLPFHFSKFHPPSIEFSSFKISTAGIYFLQMFLVITILEMDTGVTWIGCGWCRGKLSDTQHCLLMACINCTCKFLTYWVYLKFIRNQGLLHWPFAAIAFITFASATVDPKGKV